MLRTVAIALLLTTACSHTTFQYRVSKRDRDALANTIGRLQMVTEAGDATALPVVVDLKGRKALTVFASTVVLDKVGDEAAEAGETKSEHSSQAASALMTIALVALAGDDRPEDFERFEAGTFEERYGEITDRIGKKMRERFDDPEGGARKRDILARAITAVAKAVDERGYRKGDIDELRAHQFSQCGFDTPIVSYRAGLMRYKDWGLAEWSDTFEEWKERLSRLHFIRVKCPSEMAVFIMAEYDDAPAPMVLMWRFFTAEQWPRVDRGLRRMFDL